MKKILTFAILMVLVSAISFAQIPIQSFDGVSADPHFTIMNEGPPSQITLSDENSDYMQGSGALKASYTIGAFHPWGSYASLIYTLTDTEPLMDWTTSDSVKIWIKVLSAATNPEYMYFRLHISDRPNPTDNIEEYIYENAVVYDAVSGWFELSMPLIERTSDGNTIPNDEGFVVMPLSWGGQRNNGNLDLDSLYQFTLVATTSGWTDPLNIPADSITVLFDFMNRTGTVVPVELTSFSAQSSGNSVVLNWQTATEINNDRFIVERKSSGTSFEQAAVIQGKGTTSEISKYSYTDKNLNNGNYSYRLKQIDHDGTFTYSNIVEVKVDNPVDYSLAQNFPNPFNPTTNITYSLKEDSQVDLSVYNLLGQKIKTLVSKKQEAGSYTVSFDASSLSNGLYLYKISTSNFTSTKKMMLIK